MCQTQTLAAPEADPTEALNLGLALRLMHHDARGVVYVNGVRAVNRCAEGAAV